MQCCEGKSTPSVVIMCWMMWTVLCEVPLVAMDWDLQSSRECLMQLCAFTHDVHTLKDVELFESSTFTPSCPHGA